MKKLFAALILGVMTASMAVPSFAATTADTPTPYATYSAISGYSASKLEASGVGRSSRAIDEIYVEMDVYVNGSSLPMVTAKTHGESRATAYKRNVKNVSQVDTMARFSNGNGFDREYDTWRK